MTTHSPRPYRVASGLSFVLAVLCAGKGELAVLAMEPESIAWRDDYGSAVEEARAANRLLWIQFTAPWCPNCTRMERDSFPHPAVVQHARASFVPLKLRSDVHEQLAVGFNLSGLPATIIVAPNREVVAIHQGYLGPAEFDTFLRDSLSQVGGKPMSLGKAAAKSTAPAQARQSGGEPKNEEPPALAGYCPVSLIRDRKLVAGLADISVRHDGRTYRFASRALYEHFRQEPDRFVPVNNGSCPVSQLDQAKKEPGDPRCGVLYKKHLFLCASEEARRQFLKEPDRYAKVDQGCRNSRP